MITFHNRTAFLDELKREHGAEDWGVDIVRVDQHRQRPNNGAESVSLIASFVGSDGDTRKVAVHCGINYINSTQDGSRQYESQKEQMKMGIAAISDEIEIRAGEFD